MLSWGRQFDICRVDFLYISALVCVGTTVNKFHSGPRTISPAAHSPNDDVSWQLTVSCLLALYSFQALRNGQMLTNRPRNPRAKRLAGLSLCHILSACLRTCSPLILCWFLGPEWGDHAHAKSEMLFLVLVRNKPQLPCGENESVILSPFLCFSNTFFWHCFSNGGIFSKPFNLASLGLNKLLK